jgi:hypothetical protein
MILDTLLFADDQVIFAKLEELQIATLQFSNITTTYNFEVSYDKTKNMILCGKHKNILQIILNNKTMEQIRNFNYLGCDTFFDCDNDLRQKINTLQSACGTIKRTLTIKLKNALLKFYIVMAVPTLLYGSECWAMIKADGRAVEAAEMEFLRCVARYTTKDQVRSDNIRQKLNTLNLNDKF